MRIACIGYRDWALKIYSNIQQNSEHSFLNISSYDTYDDKFIIDFKPDLVMFYGWSWIVSNQLINNFTCLMLHPSPLPLYRGGSPIQNQILEGKKVSKVTILVMTEELDAGPIVGQRDISLEGDISDIFSELTEKGTSITEDTYSLLFLATLVRLEIAELSWNTSKDAELELLALRFS